MLKGEEVHKISVSLAFSCVVDDTLLGPGVNPLEGSPNVKLRKLGSKARSRLPTLERGRGSSWDPRD